LLNNDTEIDDHWLERLVLALHNDQHVGSVACKMLNFSDHTVIDSAGDAMTPFASPYNRGHGEKDGERFSRQEYVFGSCAGAALYRNQVFKHIGMFDEDFVSFYEDVDLSLRAQLAGFACLYVPEAVCYHKRGATGGKASPYPVKMTERNLVAFYVKSFPAGLLIPKLPFIIAGTVRRIYRALLAGMGIPALEGFCQGLGLIPKMLRKRSRVQQLMTVEIAYLASLMEKKA
jgi:GT2 family glycosyltransferase